MTENFDIQEKGGSIFDFLSAEGRHRQKLQSAVRKLNVSLKPYDDLLTKAEVKDEEWTTLINEKTTRQRSDKVNGFGLHDPAFIRLDVRVDNGTSLFRMTFGSGGSIPIPLGGAELKPENYNYSYGAKQLILGMKDNVPTKFMRGQNYFKYEGTGINVDELPEKIDAKIVNDSSSQLGLIKLFAEGLDAVNIDTRAGAFRERPTTFYTTYSRIEGLIDQFK